jgi:hypothetical protein
VKREQERTAALHSFSRIHKSSLEEKSQEHAAPVEILETPATYRWCMMTFISNGPNPQELQKHQKLQKIMHDNHMQIPHR